jgi:hypothetical protein
MLDCFGGSRPQLDEFALGFPMKHFVRANMRHFALEQQAKGVSMLYHFSGLCFL